MNLLSFFAFGVFAAESVVSPVGNPAIIPFDQTISTPSVSFGKTREPETVSEANSLPPQPTKPHITIALLGDSMIDTLGDFGILTKLLSSLYPNTKLTILNYGVGATTVLDGIKRLTESYRYKDKEMPALISQKPDIILVESFAYNPLPHQDGGLAKQLEVLSDIITILETHLPRTKIVLAATIAPNSISFAQGAKDVDFSQEEKSSRIGEIHQGLSGTIALANRLHVPLVDAYTRSLGASGDGQTSYVRSTDHIHPSERGAMLMAQELARTIIDHNLLL